MLTIPIPMVSFILLGFLVVQSIMRAEATNKILTIFIAACALQGLVISLAQHYNIPLFLKVQPVTASLIPAIGWIAFQTTARRQPDPKRDWVHILPALATMFGVSLAPHMMGFDLRIILLDVLIPATFIFYGSAILFSLSKGADNLPFASLGAGDQPAKIWRLIAYALIGSAFTDALIIALQIAGLSQLQPWILSFYTSIILLTVGWLSLSKNLAAIDINTAEIELPEYITQQDQDLINQLTEFMEQEKAYLDPDLTLNRIARRLRIPAKQISTSVNRHTGENVSRFINNYRIKVACEEILKSQNVTSTMLNSGFNTKSNFNREFKRIMGVSPTSWRQQNTDQSDTSANHL